MEKSKADHLKALGPDLRIVTDKGGSHFTAKRAGQCAFLDRDQLCEIHGSHGPEAKPLTCQLFPFVLTPTDRGVSVGLSFYCPSVRAGHGRDIQEHRSNLERWLGELQLSANSGRPIIIFGTVTTGTVGYEFLERELRDRLLVSEPIELLRGFHWTLCHQYQEFGRQSPEKLFSPAPHPPSQQESRLVSELLSLAGLAEHPNDEISEDEVHDKGLSKRYLLSLLHRKFLLKGPSLLESLSLLSVIAQAIKRCGRETDRAIERLELLLTHGEGAFHLTFSVPD